MIEGAAMTGGAIVFVIAGPDPHGVAVIIGGGAIAGGAAMFCCCEALW